MNKSELTMETKLKQEPVADGGGMPPLDEECSDSDVVLRAVRWTGRCFALIDEDAEDDVIAEGESADHAGIEAEWDLIRRERQLASSQEALRAARELIEEYRESHINSRRPCVDDTLGGISTSTDSRCSTCKEADSSRGEQPMTPLAVVWRDAKYKTQWWARVYRNGRCDWLQGGFKSSRKAQNAVERRMATKLAEGSTKS